jgi:ribonuclease HI
VGRKEERFVLSILDGLDWKAAAAGAGISERKARAFLESVAGFAATVGGVPEFVAPQEPAPPSARAERPSPIHEELILHTDGASLGNPGPAGAGVVIATPSGEIVGEFHEHLGRATSNAAEYEAVRLGLSKAIGLGARRVRVRLDSELVANQLCGRYKVRHPKLLEAYLKVEGLISQLDDISFEAIPREQNTRADRLAQMGARRGRG